VDRRRESEYLLVRFQVRKGDFLRYAEAEMALERLRKIRQKKAMTGRLKGSQKERFDAFLSRQKQLLEQYNKEQEEEKKREEEEEQDSKKKRKRKSDDYKKLDKDKIAPRGLGSSRGDGSIIKLIHRIFQSAERKWKADLSIFLAHAEFAKEVKTYRILTQIYAQALQFHPRNTSLWIEAASLEFFGSKPNEVDEDDLDDNSPVDSGYHGGSVHGARVLLQRGIRVNPKSQDLWVQYFSLEYHFIQKLRGRREILKLQSVSTNENEDENVNQAPGFYEGAIPKVVYQNAIKEIPQDVSFRLEFWHTCQQFPMTLNMQKLIISDIQRDFADKPEAWIARAAFAFSTSEPGFETDKTSLVDTTSRVPNLLEVLQNAIQKLNNSEMLSKIVEFLQELLKGSRQQLTEQEEVTILDFLTKRLEEAERDNILSAKLILLWVDLLMENNQQDQSISILSRNTLDNSTFVQEPEIWLKLADLIFDQINSTQSSDAAAAKKASSTLQLAIESVPMDHPKYLSLLTRLFDYRLLWADKTSFECNNDISEIFHKIFLFSSHESNQALVEVSETIGQTCLNYLQRAALVGGNVASTLISDFILIRCSSHLTSHVHALEPFFLSCLDLERKNKCLKRLSKLYDIIITVIKRSDYQKDPILYDMLRRIQQARVEDVGL